MANMSGANLKDSNVLGTNMLSTNMLGANLTPFFLQKHLKLPFMAEEVQMNYLFTYLHFQL
jgi:uncharacterized protein YjbI with pentapeptide repeats